MSARPSRSAAGSGGHERVGSGWTLGEGSGMEWSSTALLDRPRQGVDVGRIAGEDDLDEGVALLLDVPGVGDEEGVVIVLGLAELVDRDLALGGVEDHLAFPDVDPVEGPDPLDRLVQGALLGGGGRNLRRSAGVTAGHRIGRGNHAGAAARTGTSSIGRAGVEHGDQDRQDDVPHSGPRRLTASLTTICTLLAPRLWWYVCRLFSQQIFHHNLSLFSHLSYILAQFIYV